MKKFNEFVNEGTWALPKNPEEQKVAKSYIKTIESLKGELYNLVGDDELFDCFDKAITRIKELVKISPEGKDWGK